MKYFGFALMAGAFVLSSPALADDWPCEVALCLANPQGPTAAPDCVPPIKKLWRHLALGRPIPFCALAHSNGPTANYTSIAPANCPSDQQYYGGPSGTELMCRVSGYITINNPSTGASQVWVNTQSTDGDTGRELGNSSDLIDQQR